MSDAGSDPDEVEVVSELSSEQRTSIKEAFELFDPEKTGHIQTSDLKVALRAAGFEPTKAEINKIITEFDGKKSNKLTYDKFFKIAAAKMADKEISEQVLKAFRLFDNDNTSKISFKNLKRVAKELGETLTNDELHEMIEEADLDGDGQINQEEFLRIMKKTKLY